MIGKYELRSLHAPSLTGFPLYLFSLFVRFIGQYIGFANLLLSDSNLYLLRKQRPLLSKYPSAFYPIPPANIAHQTFSPELLNVFYLLLHGLFPFDYAYKSLKITPEQVATTLIHHLRSHANTSINAVIKYKQENILESARESTLRYAQGRPISILDGVPVAIKDQVDVEGFETGLGTNYMNKNQPASSNDFVVQRLIDLGAIIIGKTNMHELGFDVTNINPHTGICRNPYNLSHVPGGSSGGSAASVAQGLCPLALGVDGGGSTRIPASYCGLYGLKATFGRSASVDGSVGHTGPIAGCARDLAIGYMAMAGPDSKQFATMLQPPALFRECIGPMKDLRGLRIGIYRDFFQHANAEIVERCDETIGSLISRGAQIVEIEIPHLELCRVGHVIVISAEITAGIDDFSVASPPVSVQATVFSKLQPSDYILGCKARSLMLKVMQEIFEQVDVIVTPSTGCLAPSIPPNAEKYGSVNLMETSEAMRFAFLGNFTGIPAISIPIGLSHLKKLPIGIQFMSKWWQEDILLKLAFTIEEMVRTEVPESSIDLLSN